MTPTYGVASKTVGVWREVELEGVEGIEERCAWLTPARPMRRRLAKASEDLRMGSSGRDAA
jgi:hypothetical protein